MIVLAQRLADRLALRRQERIRHAAADDQSIDLVEEIAEQIELGRHLGAADNGRDRALRRVQRFFQSCELFLHGAAGIGGEEVRDRFDRGVRPVRDREGVIDIDVAELCKPGANAGSFFSSPL